MAYPLRFKRARMTNNVLEFGVMTDSDAHMAVSNCQGADTPTAPMYELGKLTLNNNKVYVSVICLQMCEFFSSPEPLKLSHSQTSKLQKFFFRFPLLFFIKDMTVKFMCSEPLCVTASHFIPTLGGANIHTQFT